MLTPDDRAQIVAAIEGLRKEWRAKATDLRRMHLNPQADLCDLHAIDLDAVLALPQLAGDGKADGVALIAEKAPR